MPSDPTTKKILVIDDDESHVTVVEYALRKEGFKVLTATDGNDAKQKLNMIQPDLITTDLMLPGMSGLELVRYLQSEGMGSVPVIVITGRTVEGQVNDEQVLRQEPNVKDFLGKPLKVQALVMRIHQILDTFSIKKAQT